MSNKKSIQVKPYQRKTIFKDGKLVPTKQRVSKPRRGRIGNRANTVNSRIGSLGDPGLARTLTFSENLKRDQLAGESVYIIRARHGIPESVPVYTKYEYLSHKINGTKNVIRVLNYKDLQARGYGVDRFYYLK